MKDWEQQQTISRNENTQKALNCVPMQQSINSKSPPPEVPRPPQPLAFGQPTVPGIYYVPWSGLQTQSGSGYYQNCLATIVPVSPAFKTQAGALHTQVLLFIRQTIC